MAVAWKTRPIFSTILESGFGFCGHTHFYSKTGVGVAWPRTEEGTESFGHTIDIEGLKFKRQKRHLHQTFAFSSQSGLDHWSTPGGIEKLVKFVSSAPLVVGNH